MTSNPNSAPAGESSGVAQADARMIRERHRVHEISCKGIAIVFFVLGVFFALGGLIMPFDPQVTSDRIITYAVCALILLIGLLFIITAVGLISLRPWSRAPSIGISILSLVVFPVGTIIGGWLLIVLLSGKGKTIFSQQYQEMMAVT